jgi:hypothetical protein
MGQGEHSLLSASAAHRWLTCTPSAVLEREQGVDECSVYAAEGPAAHEYARLRLMSLYGYLDAAAYAHELEQFMQTPDYQNFYDAEFNEYVEEYIRYVKGITDNLTDYDIDFERRVDFSDVVPDGFGTADTIIIDKKNEKGYVIDLKFGQGVPVSAKENPQLRLYAIGLIHEFDVKSVEMVIVQPRLASVDTDIMTALELVIWGYDYVKPKAELAVKGEGPLKSSEEACRFCKLRGSCKVRADSQLAVAKQEFAIIDPQKTMIQLLSPEQMSKILDIAPVFVEWFKDVQSFALGQLIAGVNIPGYKLVEGRSNRVITDPDKVKDILLEKGFKEQDLMKPPEMQGISTLERIVGKKLFTDLCGEYLVKPTGKLTMAEDNDRRPAVSTLAIAQNEFARTIIEQED